MSFSILRRFRKDAKMLVGCLHIVSMDQKSERQRPRTPSLPKVVPNAIGPLFEHHVDSQNHSGSDSAKAFDVSATKLTLGSDIVMPSRRLLDLDSQTMRDQSSVSKRLVHGDMQFEAEVTNTLWT